MRSAKLFAAAIIVIASFCTAQKVVADGNIIVHRTATVRFGNSYGAGNRFSWGPYSLNRSLGYIPTPPYFAIHPPVHYSHHVSVPYGMSPNPIVSYSPVVKTHYERPIPPPQVVHNPYVTEATEETHEEVEAAVMEESAEMLPEEVGEELPASEEVSAPAPPAETEEKAAEEVSEAIMPEIIDASGNVLEPAIEPVTIENDK